MDFQAEGPYRAGLTGKPKLWVEKVVPGKGFGNSVEGLGPLQPGTEKAGVGTQGEGSYRP